MLSPIFSILKLAFKVALFSLIVLTLGNIFGWSGKTVSDRIRTQLSTAERKIDHAAGEARNWVAEKGREILPEPRKQERDPEQIPPSERQKLRNLIRELNGSQTKR
ncbi:MAG TPA: hypothetical protein VM598_12010 [Bdellovibrionota bacterium]|nr:hypothetical protein [Bdellovibrionota bacterium]